MSIETIVPAVYIEEDATPALSVSQGATAVPLFVGNFDPIETGNQGKLLRISGWLEFTQLFTVNSTGYTASATITLNTDTDDEEDDDSGTTTPGTGGTTGTAADTRAAAPTYDISDANAETNVTTLALQAQWPGRYATFSIMAGASVMSCRLAIVRSGAVTMTGSMHWSRRCRRRKSWRR